LEPDYGGIEGEAGIKRSIAVLKNKKACKVSVLEQASFRRFKTRFLQTTRD
jgi:hypothetical protein